MRRALRLALPLARDAAGGEAGHRSEAEHARERVLPAEAGSAGNEVVAHMKVSKKPLVGGRMFMAGGARNGGFDAVLLGRWPDANGQLFHLKGTLVVKTKISIKI